MIRNICILFKCFHRNTNRNTEPIIIFDRKQLQISTDYNGMACFMGFRVGRRCGSNIKPESLQRPGLARIFFNFQNSTSVCRRRCPAACEAALSADSRSARGWQKSSARNPAEKPAGKSAGKPARNPVV